MSNIECCYDTDEIRSGVISNGDKATIYNFLPEKDQTTFYGSLLQAQLEPDTEHVWAENSNTDNMTSYDSLLSAQYSSPNNYPIRKRSATNEELPALSKIYLAHLHNSTLSSWPSIRKGPESERQHYQNLTAAEFPEQSTLRSSAFAQLSQIYGPLPITGEGGEVASIVNEMTWVGAYRVSLFLRDLCGGGLIGNSIGRLWVWGV